MSVNASFSLFKPNPLYRNLREDPLVARPPLVTELQSQPLSTTASHDGDASVRSEEVEDIEEGETLMDVDDNLLDEIRELQRRNAELQREKAEIQRQRMSDVAELKAELKTLQQQNEELQQEPKMDDELVELVRQLAAEKEELQTQNVELQKEAGEVYDLMEQMKEHVESLELHQQSLVAYVNKVCNDVKTVKRRTVWQKIEFDKERQQLVEELHSWKRKFEELKASEKETIAAAEATAAWEAACLNQTIEQLRGEILTVQTELDATKEELTRRGGTVDEAAETEQMLEALQDLALDLKSQVDEANAALETQKAVALREINELQDAMRDLKQRSIKQQVAHDKERQELVEEIQSWKHRAEEAHSQPVQSEPDTATASSSSDEFGERTTPVFEIDEETKETDPPIQQTEGNQADNDAMTKPVDTRQGDDGDNQHEHQIEASSSSTVAVDDEDKDNVPDSPLATPKRSDSLSFFTRLRSFSSASFGLDLEPPSTPKSGRSRTSSTASSTTSTSSATTRAAKPKPSPPVTVNTQNDYLRKQEPSRFNSTRRYM